jgi:flagellar hook assembly protein FlgD
MAEENIIALQIWDIVSVIIFESKENKLVSTMQKKKCNSTHYNYNWDGENLKEDKEATGQIKINKIQ